MSKAFLKYFKRDTLQILTDVGLLRDKKQFSMHSNYVPMLFASAEMEVADSEKRT